MSQKLPGCLDCDYVCLMLPHYFSHTCHTCLTWVAQIVRHTLACLREACYNFCVYDMWGSLLIKKILVLGVSNKKDLYLGTEGV